MRVAASLLRRTTVDAGEQQAGAFVFENLDHAEQHGVRGEQGLTGLRRQRIAEAGL